LDRYEEGSFTVRAASNGEGKGGESRIHKARPGGGDRVGALFCLVWL